MSSIPARFAAPRRRRLALLNAVLVVALAALAAVTWLQSTRKPAPAAAAARTAAVARGVVLSTVSASGNVQAAKALTLDFATGGTLAQVLVKPGRRVAAGAVLGRLDDAPARASVQQAEAGLASAKAQLAQTLAGETAAERRQDALTVAQAETQLANATAAVAAQQRTNALEAASLAAAVEQAKRQLRTDRGNLRGTVAKLHAAQAQLATDQAALGQAQTVVATDQARVAQDQAEQQRVAVGLLNAQQNQAADKDDAEAAASVASWQREQQQVQYRLSQDQATLSADQQTAADAESAVKADETDVTGDQSTIVSLEKAIVSDRNAIRGAEQSRASGLERERQSVATAKRQVVGARQSLAATRAANAVKHAPPEPATVAQQRAAVVQAQTNLETAKRTLAQTVLRAPTAGVVVSVNGVAGQSVSGGGSSAAAAASSSSGAASSSSSGFVGLTDLRGMQVVAPFSETDAAKLHPGQAATATVAALSGAKLPAHVVAVDTDSTVSSGVVTYAVTFQLDRPDARLKPGMTADVDVVVGERDGVLHVPAAAVTGSGANASVTVLRGGQPTRVPVVAGLRGDSATEIASGLKAGDEVVLPSVSIDQTGATAGGGGARFGGGGGFRGFAGGGPRG